MELSPGLESQVGSNRLLVSFPCDDLLLQIRLKLQRFQPMDRLQFRSDVPVTLRTERGGQTSDDRTQLVGGK